MKVKNNRTNRITIRLNDSEINDLELKAGLAGISISAYIRYILLHSKPPVHKFDKTMIVLISKILNCLEGIVKHIDTSKEIDGIVFKNILAIKNYMDSLPSKD